MGLFGANGTPGGVLTGDMIKREVHKGKIKISDFDPVNLNGNSYNIRLGGKITVYRAIRVIDLHDPDTYKDTETYEIPEDGITLRPGTLYLIPTREIIGSNYYEPIITGRSSIGRLGIEIHREAGFGDIGFIGRWTMQVSVMYPIIIYPNEPIAQVYFLTPYGQITELYHGKYQGVHDVVPSLWKAAGSAQDI